MFSQFTLSTLRSSQLRAAHQWPRLYNRPVAVLKVMGRARPMSEATTWVPSNMHLSKMNMSHEPTTDDCRELTRLEECMWCAETRFDMTFMEAHLAPDFFEFGRSGKTYTRAEILAGPTLSFSAQLPLPNLSVRMLSPNTAQLTYCSAATFDGVVEHARRSSIWTRAQGTWVMRFHQGTAYLP